MTQHLFRPLRKGETAKKVTLFPPAPFFRRTGALSSPNIFCRFSGKSRSFSGGARRTLLAENWQPARDSAVSRGRGKNNPANGQRKESFHSPDFFSPGPGEVGGRMG